MARRIWSWIASHALSLCGLASHGLLTRQLAGPAGLVLQTVVPFSGLVFAAALAVIDQIVTPNISPFLLGTVFVGTAFLIRPGVALGL